MVDHYSNGWANLTVVLATLATVSGAVYVPRPSPSSQWSASGASADSTMNAMRRRFVLILVLAASAAAATGHAADKSGLPAWLAGHWRMQSGEIVVEEVWMAPAGDVMPGMARTLRPGGKAFIEYTRIESRGDGLYFVAQPGGVAPTDFKLVESRARSVVFENTAHDFPQRVRYEVRDDGALAASISGRQDGQTRTESWLYQRVGAAPAR
jgi:hypothetical protein